MPGEYYVYVHRKKTDGSVFYVGQGKGKRWKSWSRSRYWKYVVKKHGFTTEKVVDNLPQRCALSIERALIARYGRDNLVNLTDGGEIGPSGYIPSPERLAQLRAMRHTPEVKAKISEAMRGDKHPHFDPTLYTLVHPHHGTVTATRYDFSVTYGFSSYKASKVISGEFNSYHGWHLPGVDPTRRLREETKAKISASLIGNQHCKGNVLSESHRANISKATKGRPLPKERAEKRFGTGNPNYKDETITLVHDDHGEVCATRQGFISRFAIGKACLTAVIKGKQKSAKGWRLPC